MFDVGFWEIALILLVALVVVGPERLPGLVRSVGYWIGRARRFVATVKADIDRELNTEELRSLLDKQAREVAQLREMLHETKAAVSADHPAPTPFLNDKPLPGKQEPPSSDGAGK
jgi:sec-independent protein translocase protein TatB